MTIRLQMLVLMCFNHLSTAINSENVACQPHSATADLIEFNCNVSLVKPMGDFSVTVISNNVSATNQSVVGSDCEHSQGTGSVEIYICVFVVNITLLGPGNHKIHFAAWANGSDPKTTQVTSTELDIPLPGEVQEPVCLPTEFDYLMKIGYVTCLAPISYGRVSCSLNVRTNGTLIRTGISTTMHSTTKIYPASEGNPNTFFYQCKLSYELVSLGPGLQEFQVNMTNVNPDVKSSSKPSNWTTPVRFHAQTLINFTISGHEDIIQVELGHNVTFACSTDGYPPTDRYIRHEPFYSDFIYKRDLLDKQLNYSITDCQQAGKYTCRSYGRIAAWDFIDKAVYVEIPCPLGYFYKASNETNRQYIGNYHDTIKLSIPVLGSPAPKKMRLSRRNSGKQTVSDDFFSNEVSLVYKKEIGPLGSIYVEFLDLQLISKSTYCILSVDNGVGEQSLFEFSIQYNAGASLMLKQIENCYLVVIILSVILVID